MKKALLVTLIAMMMMADLLLTAYYFDHYNHIISEGNPFFHTQYGYLVIVFNIIYLISVFFASKFYINHQTKVISAPHTWVYTKKLFQGHSSKFILVIACFTYIISSFVSRTTVILDWVMFGIYKEGFNDSFYALFRDKLPFGRYDVLTGIFSFLIAIPLWFKFEFMKSKKIQENV